MANQKRAVFAFSRGRAAESGSTNVVYLFIGELWDERSVSLEAAVDSHVIFVPSLRAKKCYQMAGGISAGKCHPRIAPALFITRLNNQALNDCFSFVLICTKLLPLCRLSKAEHILYLIFFIHS